MKKKYNKTQISNFLQHIDYRANNISNTGIIREYTIDIANRIIKISKFINEKYPDMDVVPKLIDNLLHNKTIRFSYEYFKYLCKMIYNSDKSDDHRYDSILNFINNDKFIDILLRCISITNYEYNKGVGNTCDTDCIILKLPYFSNELLNNISSNLSSDEFLFLLRLIMDKDINIKITTEINRQTYSDVIEKIIGDSEAEKKIFHYIYPYFTNSNYFIGYEIYKLFVSYKDMPDVADYLFRNIRNFINDNIDRISFDKIDSILDCLIGDIKFLINYKHKDFDLFSLFVSNDIPPIVFTSDLDFIDDVNKFFVDHIIKEGFNFNDLKLRYSRSMHYFEEAIMNLFNLYNINKLFTKKLISKIFKEQGNRFCLMSELLSQYRLILNRVQDADLCLNDNLGSFLISLLDKDDGEIMSCINLFNNLRSTIFCIKLREECYKYVFYPVFNIGGKIIDCTKEKDYRQRTIIRKEIFTHILMFLANKNDINKCISFYNKFNKFFLKFSGRKVVVNEELIEYIYSNSEKNIKSILYV